jgi:hypothetical protein
MLAFHQAAEETVHHDVTLLFENLDPLPSSQDAPSLSNAGTAPAIGLH